MEKQLFTFAIVDQNTPMDTDPFWDFIGSFPQNHLEMPTIMAYLQSLGFDHNSHRISEQDKKTLKYIFKHFQDMRPLLPPQKMEDLFSMEDPARGQPIHVRFTAKNESYRYSENKILQDAIRQHRHGGYSYQISTAPDGTMSLWFKYQQIIGSVRVCEILPE